jgi:hypothetical protein
VRLDHLLSKEHLDRKTVQEPAICACQVGVLEGGDTGQLEPATVLHVSTTSSEVGKAVGNAAGNGEQI